MARKKKAVNDNSLETFESGTAGTAETLNYQSVLANYNDNSQLISFIAPDGSPYFIGGQAGVNSIIAGANVTIDPPSGQGNVTINVMEVGTVQSVALAMPSAFTVANSPITTSGTLVVGYGTGQIPPANLGVGTTGQNDLFLNSAGNWVQVIGSEVPFLRFNGSAIGGANQTFSDISLTIYNNDPTLLTVLVNGVGLTPPTVSPASAGSYTLTDDTLTITDYLEPNVTVEVVSKTLIANGETVGTVRSVAMTVPQGLSLLGSPITVQGTLALNWDAMAYIPQTSLGSGTTGSNTVLTGGTNNATWVSFTGSLVDTASTQTLTNKTLDGALSNNMPMPIQPDQIATKEYVDTVALGLTPFQVKYGTTGALTGTWTYANGSSGVGATLTSAVNIALTIDGVTPIVGDRVLIKDQTSALQNGIYSVTQLSNATQANILTRVVDYDIWTELYHSLINIELGTTLQNASYISVVPATGTIGTDPINYVAYGGVATVIPVAKGGTGRNTLDANKILVGNGGNNVVSAANLYVDNSSNLGINTATPLAGLDINASARIVQAFEKLTVVSSSLTGLQVIDTTVSPIYFYTANATGNFQFNITGNINTVLPIGHSMTVTIITTQGATAYYCNANPTIDGSSSNVVTIWQGPVAPISGNINSRDIYTFTIIKTANSIYTVLAVRAQYGGIL